jgi:hypothetical protein
MSIIEINNVIQEITKLNIVKTNLMCMDEWDRCVLSSGECEEDRLDREWLDGPEDLKMFIKHKIFITVYQKRIKLLFNYSN